MEYFLETKKFEIVKYIWYNKNGDKIWKILILEEDICIQFNTI